MKGLKINPFICLFVSDRVLINMKKLYPKWELGKRITHYYVQKIGQCLWILFATFIICIGLHYSEKNKNIINDGKIMRNTYGGGTKSVDLMVTKQGDEASSDISFDISERRYSEAELEEMLQEFYEKLLRIIIGNNDSFDHVTNDLNFVKSVDGYPFTIRYKTDNPFVISQEGKINNSEDYSDGVEVLITVNIEYFDFSQEKQFYICIYEKELTEDEMFAKKLSEKLEEEDIKSGETNFYILPATVDGIPVSFSEKRESNIKLIIILSVILLVTTYLAKDKELEKEVEKRQKEMMRDYPSLINRFTLFYNAGMPIKRIWLRVCDDYQDQVTETGRRRYIYEEMMYTKTQLMQGVSETMAYEEFAKRVNLPKYRIFISLLIQAVQIGRKDLRSSMRNECEDAFLARKNNAKKEFEEAGTKLLIPMFMMLSVVIIIVLFPAFYSFRL